MEIGSSTQQVVLKTSCVLVSSRDLMISLALCGNSMYCRLGPSERQSVWLAVLPAICLPPSRQIAPQPHEQGHCFTSLALGCTTKHLSKRKRIRENKQHGQFAVEMLLLVWLSETP